MNIKKMFFEQNIEIIRTTNGILYKENGIEKDEKWFTQKLKGKFLDATKTHILANKNNQLKCLLQKFFDNKLPLEEFIIQTFKITEKNNLIGKYQNVLDSWAMIKETKTEDVIKDWKKINYELKQIYGKQLKLFVGHLYFNHAKTINKICESENSHLQKVLKSFSSNTLNPKTKEEKVKVSKSFSIVIEQNELKYIPIQSFCNYNINKTETPKTIFDLKMLVKNEKVNENFFNFYTFTIKLIKGKMFQNLNLEKGFNRETRNFQNLYYAIKRNIFYYVINTKDFNNENQAKKKCTKSINKIIKDQIKNYQEKEVNNYFYDHSKIILKEKDCYTDYDLISSHNVYKLYRNLATIVGCGIINYNLDVEKNKFNENFYDFSSSKFKDNYLSERENYSNWKIPFLNELYSENENDQSKIIEYKKMAYISLQHFRNSIFHINNISKETLEKEYEYNTELLEKLFEKISEKRIENIKTKFKNHKVPVQEIVVWDDVIRSISFKKVYKKIYNIYINSYLYNKTEIKNKWSFLQVNNENEIENHNSKKFLLKWWYENDFQIWLQTLTKNKFDVEQFKNWYEETHNLKSLNNIKYPLFLTNFENINQLYFQSNEYISKIDKNSINKKRTHVEQKASENKTFEQELKKKQSFVESIWIYLFEKFINSSEKTTFEKIKKENYLNDNMIYKVKSQDDIKQHWILFVLLNLSNYELSKTQKYFENYYNRMYKNENICNVDNFKYIISEDNTINFIKIIKLVRSAKNSFLDVKVDTKTPEEKELLEKLKIESTNIDNENFELNNVNSNIARIINLYRSGLYNYEFNKLKPKVDLYKNDSSETKKYSLELSKTQRYENNQSLINAFELLKEVRYNYINWVMHREFKKSNELQELENQFTDKFKKIYNCKTENDFTLLKGEVLNSIENLVKYLNDEKLNFLINEIYKEFKEFLKNLEFDNKTKDSHKIGIKDYLSINEDFKLPKIAGIAKEQIILKESKDQIRNFKKTLDSILHLNHAGNNEVNNELSKVFNDMKEVINELRKNLNYQRNKKNQITPSLIRLFWKKGLDLQFEFKNHKIDKIDIKSRINIVNEFNNTSKFKDKMLLDAEIDMYKIILGI